MLKSKPKKNKNIKNKNKKKQSKEEQPKLTIKEKLAQKRKATKARQELTNLLSKSGGVGLVLGIAAFFAGGIKLAVPAMMGVIVLALSYKYPRQALLGFIFYVPFAGTVTYLLGGNAILQLAKDGFYVPAALALWQKCRKQNLPFIIPQDIKKPLFILLGLCICTLLFVNGMQQFNPPPAPLFKTLPKSMPLGMGILGLQGIYGLHTLNDLCLLFNSQQKGFSVYIKNPSRPDTRVLFARSCSICVISCRHLSGDS